MRVARWLLSMYLLVAWIACFLVYLGDAHGLAVGAWSDQQEHLLVVLVPMAALLVVLGGVPVDGGNGLHMLVVAVTALVQAAMLYVVVDLLRRPSTLHSAHL